MSGSTADYGSIRYGMPRLQIVSRDDHSAANGAVHTLDSHATGMSVENPMVWLLLIFGVTVGLVSFSTSARIGKFAASASAG